MNFRIDAGLENRIKDFCDERKITASEFMRQAAEEYLKPKSGQREIRLLERIFVISHSSATAILDQSGNGKDYIEKAKAALEDIEKN